jgi:hypothetical protein
VQHRTLGYKTLWCVRGTLLARHLNLAHHLPLRHIVAKTLTKISYIPRHFSQFLNFPY